MKSIAIITVGALVQSVSAGGCGLGCNTFGNDVHGVQNIVDGAYNGVYG
jgi:hypothetical protein